MLAIQSYKSYKMLVTRAFVDVFSIAFVASKRKLHTLNCRLQYSYSLLQLLQSNTVYNSAWETQSMKTSFAQNVQGTMSLPMK